MKTISLRRIAALSLAFCLLFSLAAPAACAAWEGTHQDAIGGVVSVLAQEGIGSGFGVGRAGEPTDIFITNRHVVANEDGSISRDVYIMLGDGALTYYFNRYGTFTRSETDESLLLQCEVLYPREGDPEYPDVAVLRAERVLEDHIALPLKSGFDVHSGETVYAMGFPGSADDYLGMEPYENGYRQRISASTGSVTVTQGVISRTVTLHELDGTTAFQHTAQSNHGNSGGPLVTADGYVVGIHTYGFNRADNGVSEYRGAIYVDYAMQKLDALGIPYDRYAADVPAGEEAERGFPLWPIVLAAGLVIAAGITVLVIVLLRRKKRAGNKDIPASPWAILGHGGIYDGKRYPISGVLRIGRDSSRSDLVYPWDTRGVSGAHCRVENRGGMLLLIDSGSSYGTFLNGKRLAPETPVRLRVGDHFYLAEEKNSFTVENTAQ